MPERPFSRPASARAAALLALLVPLLLLVHLVHLFPVAANAEERPNILFLFADDWGDLLGYYADIDGPGTLADFVPTPHLDALAKDSVVFRNAHVSAPSCTPCRSAILTGQHFWRTRSASILRGAVWDFTLPSYPVLQREAGYHIGYTYKVWGPGTPGNAPFTGEERYQDAGARFNVFSQTVAALMEAGKSMEEAKGELYEEVRSNFRAFLEAREEGRPFSYWFGPTNVHRKWIKGSGKELWGVDPDALEGRMPPYLPDVHAVREDLADYIGEIAAWDASVGAVLEELDRTGERERTLIVVSGDHGPPGFPYGKCNLYEFGTGVPLLVGGPGVKGGRVVEDFVSLTDLAPTFLEAGGIPLPEEMTGRSLWPVLESEAGGLVDPERTRVFTGRERHVEVARADYSPYPQRAIRTRSHSFIVNFKPERWPMGDPYGLEGSDPLDVYELENTTRLTLPDEDAGPTKAFLVNARASPEWSGHFDWVYGRRPRYELYDLENDPHETANLAGDPAYAEIKKQLLEELMTELQETGDPRLVDDGRFFETPPMAGPLPDEDAFWNRGKAAKGKGGAGGAGGGKGKSGR